MPRPPRWQLLPLMSLLWAAAPALAGDDPPSTEHLPFVFSDAFYVENGLEPAELVGVKDGQDGLSVLDVPIEPWQGDVRILATNGGYDASGHVLFYPDPPAMFFESGFQDGPAGERARELADQFQAFIFPQASGEPYSPAPPNRRQDNLFDTTMGYVSNNPLGLWRLTFVRYTDAAFDTPEGNAELADLAERNGTDLDGTPILKRKGEIERLEDRGLVELYTRPGDGSQGPPWVV